MRPLTVFLFTASALAAADPALTIYNQNFAVVRDTIVLDLHKGENQISQTGITAELEPESVMLRDLSGNVPLRILEQFYRADPVSSQLLLSFFEGKTIDFSVSGPNGQTQIVSGKIVRAGGNNPNESSAPIIEVDGQLRFSLPGEPLFPALGNDSILQPTLNWVIGSDRDARVNAELAYVSLGMTWSADYNLVSSSSNNDVDLIGWASMQNNSGKTFENARIKLMAGDVNKVQPSRMGARGVFASTGMMTVNQPPVTEKSFDEYHLYTLERPATLHDKETKQVEFIRAANIASQQIYVYDGFKANLDQYRGWNADMIRQDANYGTASNNKVWVMREFRNSAANHLGMPLPAGRIRFYRRDDDGRLEFTGEDTITHTPKNETVRVFTGSAFDLTGERKRTDYRIDMNARRLDESFEIRVRNHKQESVEIRVLEHLYRWYNGEVQLASTPFTKTDAQTVEFRVTLAPGEEKTVAYNAHYTW